MGENYLRHGSRPIEPRFVDSRPHFGVVRAKNMLLEIQQVTTVRSHILDSHLLESRGLGFPKNFRL